MINIGDNPIDNILIGDTQVDRVYLGTNIVWEHSLPVVTKNYLRFKALESGTFTLTIPADVNATHLASVSYSLDNGETWVTTQNTSSAVTITTPTVALGGTVLWKGSGTQMAVSDQNYKYSNFSSTGEFECHGNIMSLLYEDNFENQLTISSGYCFDSLFKNCTNIITSPVLPATTLSTHCYENMFNGCSSLTTAPELPATNINGYCYSAMFNNCSSLIIIPEILPATTLYTYCYNYMFYNCKAITTAPELPANILKSNCYRNMFNNCSRLNYVKAMFSTTPSSSYTSNWLGGVASAGTFVKNVEATWDVRGNNGIPTNWTVEYAND